MQLDNTIFVLQEYIRRLKIPVTMESILNELEKQPGQGSFLALSDILDRWDIPNAAFNLTFSELITSEIPTPFIACFHKEYVLVLEIGTDHITVSNSKLTEYPMPAERFRRQFNGNIFLAEKDIHSGEEDFTKKMRRSFINKLRIPFVIASLVFFLLALLCFDTTFKQVLNWENGALLFIKTTGLIVSLLLLVQSIDTSNPLIQKICGGDSNKNCNAILASDAAKITDELSWSEVGFFYFSGTWLTCIFNMGNANILHIIALMNCLCLPYTFYSIFHQWRVAKQWCIFCCTIQGLFWLEFLILQHRLKTGTLGLDATHWILLFGCLGLPVITWIYLKPYLLKSSVTPITLRQLRRFKYDTEVFNKLLNAEKKYIPLSDANSLITGDPAATNTITMVSNPYCLPCGAAHVWLHDLLSEKNNIKLQIIINVGEDNADKKREVASHLHRLQAVEGKDAMENALNDWYGGTSRDYGAWVKKHPAANLFDCSDLLELQKKWCKSTQVTGTPAFFLNGRKIPQEYTYEDLRYFI